MTNRMNGGQLLRCMCNIRANMDDRQAFRLLVHQLARYELGWQTPSDARRHLNDT